MIGVPLELCDCFSYLNPVSAKAGDPRVFEMELANALPAGVRMSGCGSRREWTAASRSSGAH